MKNNLLLLSFLLALQLSGQGNNYWIKFKDKNNNLYSISNPQQFLSNTSIERRTKQNIGLNESDLPLTPLYLDMVNPYISGIVHKLKWFNLAVVKIDDPGMIVTDIREQKDTVYQTDTFSITIYDTVTTHYKITVGLHDTLDETLTFSSRDTVFDSISHAGPILIRDSIFLTDIITGNKFDGIRQLGIVDSIGEIKDNPRYAFKQQQKFEEVHPVDQQIVYPNVYGAAYRQINMLNADLLHQMGYRGEGITIAMMDNGFLNVNNIAAYDSARTRIIGTYDFVDHEQDVYEDGGHGENTLSCIATNLPGRYIGTAPDASFYLLVTEDDDAEWIMEEYNWAAAAEYADSSGAHIFSTSLGYTTFDNGTGNHTYADLTGDKTVTTHAANIAFEKGILVLNSAGNEGDKAWHYISAPADANNVLSVGAVDSAETIAGFSGKGPSYSGRIKPDICSQGVTSAVVNTSGSIGYSGGTSFSCPIMAGCAASLWGAFPDKSAREIYDAIVSSADRFQSPGNAYGYGIPNFYNAYLNLKTNYNGNVLRISPDAAVYPNPFNTDLNVALFNNADGNRKIEIFDLLGRKVYSLEVFIRDKTFEIIKLEEAQWWPSGEYILRLDGEKSLSHPVFKINN
ncbi:MAG: S8 family serine peptidase [Bacteroidota bacterium]